MASAKGIIIENGIVRPIKMTGNRSLLSSLFRNLIDNAIAYSGGDRIKLEIGSHNAESVTLTVADNGCGVAEEHLPRLFERFYRVDKGRSRKEGGTGLGLSIVKNAVLLHKGTISVENQPTGGLKFIIKFRTQSW